ncbi:MAG: pitrilysin family protein [Cyclobacteriaceae bacterium]
MKTLYISVLVFFANLMAVHAQVDRSVLPEPGPAPAIEIQDPATFESQNGLKVFVVPNDKLPRITFSLILDRDPLFEGDNAGLTSFVGEMMMGGTQSRTKEELDEEIDFIGASLNAGSTSITGSSLKKHQKKLLELMTDVLYHPVFPQEELDKQKKQTLTGLATTKDDPDYLSGILTNALVYGKDHPYGENMTEETVGNVDLEDIKTYYKTYFRPNIAYLAIVGDINKAEAENLVEKHFSQWEKSDVPTHKYDKPVPPESNHVALLDRSSAVQSVLKMSYPLEMHVTKEDFLSTRVLNFILGGGFNSRLNANLRETKGYTYGARSNIGSDRLMASFTASASVRTEVTDSAVHEMLYEIRNMEENGIDEDELKTAKANLSGSFARSLESPTTIASFAINIARYNLPKDFYATYLKRLEALTVEDINAAARKYLNPENLYITVVGNGSDIKEGLEQFGEVKLYNNNGEEVQEIILTEADLNVDEVLEKYVEAIGGKTAAEKIQSARIEMVAEIQGTKLNMITIHDIPNQRMVQKVMMMGNEASKTILKNGEATVSAMGQSQTLTDEQYEDVKMASLWIIPELHYESLGYSMELDGVKEIDGDPAYKLIITNPTGGKVTNYYSVSSGLKIKSENEVSGEISYLAYEDFEGVMFPVELAMKSPMIPVVLNSKVEGIELNIDMNEEDFN